MELKILEILNKHEELCAAEITAHAFKFIEWLHDNTDDTRMITSKKAYKKWWCTPLRGWFTVEQLYEYWLTVK